VIAPLRSLGVALLAAALAAGCGPAEPPGAEPVRVAAAVSTRDALAQIARDFEAETGLRVEINPGPSSRLAKQIVEGGPAELFLSADQANADYLQEKGYVGQRRSLLRNTLVVIAPRDGQLAVNTLADLAKPEVKRLALALEKVPAGEYAREALRATPGNVWSAVQDRVVGGEDVRATLTLVERGADAGIVYATDVVGVSRVKVLFAVPPTLHRPIAYPLVLVKRPTIRPEAQRFYDYLLSDKAAERFRQAQFLRAE
jgi:molybdate transport system substrate-binding protein